MRLGRSPSFWNANQIQGRAVKLRGGFFSSPGQKIHPGIRAGKPEEDLISESRSSSMYHVKLQQCFTVGITTTFCRVLTTFRCALSFSKFYKSLNVPILWGFSVCVPGVLGCKRKQKKHAIKWSPKIIYHKTRFMKNAWFSPKTSI